MQETATVQLQACWFSSSGREHLPGRSSAPPATLGHDSDGGSPQEAGASVCCRYSQAVPACVAAKPVMLYAVLQEMQAHAAVICCHRKASVVTINFSLPA